MLKKGLGTRKITVGVGFAICTLVLLSSCASTEEDKTKDWTAEQLFNEGHRLMADKKCKDAQPFYEKVQSRYPFGLHAQQAMLESIYCNYLDEEWAMVGALSNAFIKQYPTHPALDYVYYTQGMANFRVTTGFWAWITMYDKTYLDPQASVDALKSFSTLVEKFPSSPYAFAAYQQQRFLEEVLAKYEYRVATTYFEYGAYVASVSRATEALKRYPRTQSQEPLLEILARSYAALHLPKLQADTVAILQKNFPNNDYGKNVALPAGN